MSAIEDLWNAVLGWANKNAQLYVGASIPKKRTDLDGPDDPLVPLRSYVRVWLTDMYLTQARKWGRDLFPAVHTSISLKFGPQAVKITHVTDGSGQLARGPNKDYALTDLIPFNGGTVEIQSALIALKGTDYVQKSIGILKDFSGLVVAPLGQALNVAEKVSNGMQSLFGAGNGEITLGFHRQYMAAGGGGGGNVLRPGYTAVILADPNKLRVDGLSVKDSQLYYAEREGDSPKLFDLHDFMLLRIEARDERDNWRLTNIEEPLNQAIQATVEGNAQKAKEYKTAALLVVWQSPDLAVQDRRRVADAIEAELAHIGGARQLVGGKMPTLTDIMERRAASVQQALRDPELTFAEILRR
jgi:hypothetical protein